MTNIQKQNSFLPTVAMLLVAVTWGASFAVTKTVLTYYEPEFVVMTRLTLGAIFFLFCLRTLKRTKLQRRDIPIFIMMILFEPCLFFLLESYALTYTSASQAGMIVATSPLFTAVAAWIFLHERPGLLMWTGFFIAIGGIVLLSFDSIESEYAPNPVLGNILEALCMCAGAGFIVCAKKLGGRYSPFFMAASQAVGGSIFFIILNIIRGTELPTTFELTPVLCLLYLGLFITFGCITMFNYGVSNLPAATSAGLLNLVPFMAILFGALLLDETLSNIQWIAGGVVITGVIISQRAKVKTRRPEETKKQCIQTAEPVKSTGTSG